LAVERLDQTYERRDGPGDVRRYAYSAPAFDFHCELIYDDAGLLLEYPGIGTRVSSA
jgi:hypothetical protein